MLDVEVVAIDDPAVLQARMEPVAAGLEIDGNVTGSAPWLVEHRAQSSLAGFVVEISKSDSREPASGVRALAKEWAGHPAGSLVIDGMPRSELEHLCNVFNLSAAGVTVEPDVPLVQVDLPRTAMFHTWSYTQDSGWARHTLEQIGVPFELIHKDHLRAGDLLEHYDVIVVPTQRNRSLATIVQGICLLYTSPSPRDS